MVEVVASYGTMWLSPRRALALAPRKTRKEAKTRFLQQQQLETWLRLGLEFCA